MLLKTIFLASLLFLLTFGSTSFAERGLNNNDFINQMSDPNLDNRVRNLERSVRILDQRIQTLEAILSRNPPPAHQGPKGVSCMIVDSGFKKTFYAKGKSILEAEYNTKLECQKTLHPSNCQNITKCSDLQKYENENGYFCILNDSGFKKTFKGEGSDLVEAEAKAKQACQAEVNAAYCGPVEPRCDSY
ncbi:MAG TPA: hypothetical protein PLJ21_08120 [Pseudobdellovibrionaceae bacterium]|nr:hypothetical protein [Pseudobdellovibrionaceae bacterium]